MPWSLGCAVAERSADSLHFLRVAISYTLFEIAHCVRAARPKTCRNRGLARG